jgi:hypothetical protein
MIQNENYDEEVNEYNDEHDIDREMNMKEIEDVSDIKNKETEQEKDENYENDKFNLPLTMENQKNSDYLKINNEQNSFDELSLFKELEDKWLDIEKKRKKNLKKKNNDLLDSKSNNSTIYSLGILQNWKGIIKESRKKYNERKLREEGNNEFEKYVKNKMKELKCLTNPNINSEDNVKQRIKSYFDDGKKNYSNYNYYQTSYNNNNTSNSGIKSFLKDDDEIDKKINKINFFKNTQKKIPLIQTKENKVKNKIRNVFGIITKNKDLINNRTDSKYSELSINELNKNFDEIMGNLSNDYKQKSKMSITKKFKKQNLDCSNSFSNNYQNKNRNNIEKKLMENKILLNDLLPESGIGNKKEFKNNESFNKNNFLTYSIDEKKRNKTNLNPIRISYVCKTNNFETISNKFAGLTSPTVSKLIY